MDQVWLDVGPGVQVAVSRAEALSLDRKGMARLYRRTVIGASRREAKLWAEDQLLQRTLALEALRHDEGQA